MLIHFIWIGKESLKYSDYLAVRTASIVYPNATILIWTDNITYSSYGNKLKSIYGMQNLPKEWFNRLEQVKHLANKVDYLRLKLLKKFGGLYLDFDTLCVKRLNWEQFDKITIGNQIDNGLYVNNAIVYAPAKCKLLKYILDISFKNLQANPYEWSVNLDTLNSVINKDNCNILHKEYFYYYDWMESEKWFRYNKIEDTMYIIHWWSAANNYRNKITPDYINQSHSLYAKVVKEVL